MGKFSSYLILLLQLSSPLGSTSRQMDDALTLQVIVTFCVKPLKSLCVQEEIESRDKEIEMLEATCQTLRLEIDALQAQATR